MLIIAHRCGPEAHPQLTVAAARHSLSVGAALVEMDVRYTRDKVAVINHDDNARFLFGCPAKIADLTSNEFLSLRHRTDPAYPAYSLEQFLQSGVKDILLHCKENIGDVVRLCREYDALGRVVFGIERLEYVRQVKACHPDIPVLGFIQASGEMEETTRAIYEFALAGADFIRLWEHWDVETLLPVVLASGKKCWIMANNPQVEPLDCGYTSAPALRRWRDLGIDAILVNNPSFAQQSLCRG